MKTQSVYAITILSLLLVSAASAAPLVVSTFDSNREGWTATFGAAVGTGAIWQPTGGNPNGNLVVPDGSTTTWYYSATNGDSPQSPLIGNHSDAYGGSLEYDMRLENFGGNYYDGSGDYDIQLSGASLTLYYDSGFLPNASWNHFQVPLLASAGWRRLTFFPSTVPATEAELQSVLSNISTLQIRGNYTDATTTAHLDNVGLYSVPEPISLTLALCPLLFLFGRRSRQI